MGAGMHTLQRDCPVRPRWPPNPTQVQALPRVSKGTSREAWGPSWEGGWLVLGQLERWQRPEAADPWRRVLAAPQARWVPAT